MRAAIIALVLLSPASALAADPVGALEVVDCLGARGWAQDPDQPAVAIDVHVYFNAPPGVAGAAAVAVHADAQRDDLCMQLGTCTHGFALELPLGVRDGIDHDVWAFGIDLEGVNNPVVGGPIKVNCPAPPLVEGVRRWVTAPEVLTAWQLDTFVDLAHVDDVSLMGLAQDVDWPLAPQLATTDGTVLWIIDGTQKRAIAADALAAWGLDPATAIVMASLDAMPQGPDWRARPFLVQGSGPEVFAIDAVPCSGDACDPDEGTGGEESGESSGDESSSDDGGGESDGAPSEGSSSEGSSGDGGSLGLPGAEGGDRSQGSGCSCDARVTATPWWSMLLLACARGRARRRARDRERR